MNSNEKGARRCPPFFFLLQCVVKCIGTIGSGNHFAELQQIEEIVDKGLFEELGLDENKLYLTVHSGSRGFGRDILGKKSPLFPPLFPT